MVVVVKSTMNEVLIGRPWGIRFPFRAILTDGSTNTQTSQIDTQARTTKLRRLSKKACGGMRCVNDALTLETRERKRDKRYDRSQ